MKSIRAQYGNYFGNLSNIYVEVNKFMGTLGFDSDGNDGKVEAEIFVTSLPKELEESAKEGVGILIAVATQFGLTLTHGYTETDDLIFWFIPFSNIVSIRIVQ